jgi:hypothetical protein
MKGMKLNLAPKKISWENVRERILNAIDEEQRKNTTLIVPSTVPPDYPDVEQIEEGDKAKSDIGGRVFVIVSAND